MTPKTKQLAESILSINCYYDDEDDNNQDEEEEEGKEQKQRLAAHDRIAQQRRRALAQAMTLIESQSIKHIQQAGFLLKYVVRNMVHRLCCPPRPRARNSFDDIPVQKTNFSTNKTKYTSENTRAKKIFRLGFAGAPGAGKSSLIESLGKYILDDEGKQTQLEYDDRHDSGILYPEHHKVAVVCIDSSSSITGGSILGDKIRMMELSRHP